MDQQYSSPMQFPCEFIIKIMGHNNDQFEVESLNIIKQHFPSVAEDQISKRPSKDSNYLALSVTVNAENQAQLDATYEALTKNPAVIMAL